MFLSNFIPVKIGTDRPRDSMVSFIYHILRVQEILRGLSLVQILREISKYKFEDEVFEGAYKLALKPVC